VFGVGGRADVVTLSGQCFAQPHDGVFNLMIDGLPVVVGWRSRGLKAAAPSTAWRFHSCWTQ